MAVRYRWYKINLPVDLDDFSEHLKSTPLNDDSMFGFLFIDESQGEVKFRFLWRSTIVVTKFNENSNPVYEQISTINFLDIAFLRIQKKIFLRIENPSRSLRELMNAIESLAKAGFSCRPITFNNAWSKSVFDSVEVTRLVGLKVSGSVIDESLVVRMDLASKNGMIVENMKILNALRYTTESAVYEVIYMGIKGQISFSSGGIVRISGQLAPKILHLIEEDLDR